MSRYCDLVTVIVLTAVFAKLCLSGCGSDALSLADLSDLLSILLVKEIDLTRRGGRLVLRLVGALLGGVGSVLLTIVRQGVTVGPTGAHRIRLPGRCLRFRLG